MNVEVYPFIMATSKKNYGIAYLRTEQSIEKLWNLLRTFKIILSRGKITIGNETFTTIRYGSKLDDIFFDGVCRKESIILYPYSRKDENIRVSNFNFLYSLKKVDRGTFGNIDGLKVVRNIGDNKVCTCVSFIGIEKNKYNFLKYDTYHVLSTEELSKTKKITIEPGEYNNNLYLYLYKYIKDSYEREEKKEKQRKLF